MIINSFKRALKRTQSLSFTTSALLKNQNEPQNRNVLSRGFASGNEDLYARLGLTKSASDKDIKRAYKKATLKHLPDKGGDPTKFKNVQEAYEVSYRYHG